jgi:hypothetical protein
MAALQLSILTCSCIFLMSDELLLRFDIELAASGSPLFRRSARTLVRRGGSMCY